MESRLNPGGSVVGLHHRMHVRDLTGYLLSLPDGSKWEHYSLPSLHRPANDHLHREVGEPLDPEMWSKAELEAKRTGHAWAWGADVSTEPRGRWATGRSATTSVGQRTRLNCDRASSIHLAIDFQHQPGMHLEIGQHRVRQPVHGLP